MNSCISLYFCISTSPESCGINFAAGILRRTSIELGSGTVSFDVSLLSDLTSYQKSTMNSLQVPHSRPASFGTVLNVE